MKQIKKNKLKQIKIDPTALVAEVLHAIIKDKYEKGDFDGIEKMVDPIKSKGIADTLREFKKTEEFLCDCTKMTRPLKKGPAIQPRNP